MATSFKLGSASFISSSRVKWKFGRPCGLVLSNDPQSRICFLPRKAISSCCYNREKRAWTKNCTKMQLVAKGTSVTPNLERVELYYIYILYIIQFNGLESSLFRFGELAAFRKLDRRQAMSRSACSCSPSFMHPLECLC